MPAPAMEALCQLSAPASKRLETLKSSEIVPKESEGSFRVPKRATKRRKRIGDAVGSGEASGVALTAHPPPHAVVHGQVTR
jgi:hypothetical protein